MSDARPPRSLGYHTATVRNMLLTKLPDSLVGGRLKSRHVAQAIRIEELTLESAVWPREFDGLRIAHLSAKCDSCKPLTPYAPCAPI